MGFQRHNSTWSCLGAEAQGLLPEASAPSRLLHLKLDFSTGAHASLTLIFLPWIIPVVLLYSFKMKRTEAQRGDQTANSERVRIKIHSCLKPTENDLFPQFEGCRFVFWLNRINVQTGGSKGGPSTLRRTVCAGPAFSKSTQNEMRPSLSSKEPLCQQVLLKLLDPTTTGD